jgi:hypothetical protein
MADETSRDTTAPLVKVADLKSKVVGFSVTVSALADTVAVIGLMADSGTLVNDPPPSKVKVSAVTVPVAVIVVAFTVVALTVVMLPVVLVSVVIPPVVAVSVVNAPVLGAVLPIGVGELSAKANPAESRGALILSTVYSSTSAEVYTLNLYEAVLNQMLAWPSEFRMIGLVLAVPAPASV